MPYQIIKKEATETKDWGNVLARQLFPEGPFSIAEVTLKGSQQFGRNTKSDIAYYVLDGQGSFEFPDESDSPIGGLRQPVSQGDLVYISKGTKYRDDGNLRLLAISAPPFDPEAHIFTDD